MTPALQQALDTARKQINEQLRSRPGLTPEAMDAYTFDARFTEAGDLVLVVDVEGFIAAAAVPNFVDLMRVATTLH